MNGFDTQILSAAWVAPMDRPIIRGGAVAFSAGRIRAVGALADVRSVCARARETDLGQSVILPGLVNAHTHLELSGAQCGERPASFGDWLAGIVRHRVAAGDKLPETTSVAVASGIAQCLRFGVTTVGDISRHPNLVRPGLAAGPLRAVSYGEVQAMGQRRIHLEERLAVALEDSLVNGRLRIGLTPHAPYTVEPDAYRRCLHEAEAHGLPLTTHLAESPDEAAFLADHTGPFRQLWDLLGRFDDQVPRFAGGPIRFAQSLGLLDYPTLLAHVNYCDDAEMAILARSKASVVWCPRTHVFFGHPPHRWRDMMSAGINVAIGTDSCASTPDLNLVDDLRLVHRQSPRIDAPTLWQMATIRPAKALGLLNEVGSLTSGKSADFAVFPITTSTPLLEILESDALPSSVWIDGSPR